MKSFGILLLAACLIMATVATDDHDLSFEEICDKYGYPLEKYTVTTDDGYILQTFRIPHGNGQTYSEGRPAVLFQHGAFDSSDALFNHGPDLSPAFYLANHGYDVWLGNRRGDKYSRDHLTLDPDRDGDEFWAFSFVEPYLDDKANIEYIRQETGQDKIIFVGHSEGFTTMITALTTEEADWFKQRVSLLVGLAPVSRLDNIGTGLLKFLGANDLSIGLVKLLGIKEWFYPNIYTRTLFVNICNYLPIICETNLKYISDGDPSVNDRDILRIYLGHFPGGLSVRTLDHELQMYQAKRFQLYDYGKKENVEKYGTETPPEIPVNKINGMPIAMFVGNSDLLGDVKDNQWLKEQLGTNVVYYKEYDYGCATFYIGKDMSYLDDLVKVMRNF